MSGGSRTSGLALFDAPTAADHRRMRRARTKARAQVRDIEAEHSRSVMAAFRAELGAVVRSASPLLVSLLALLGHTLDEALAMVEPGDFWPRYPRLNGRLSGMAVHSHLLRYYAVGLKPKQLSAPPLLGKRFNLAGERDYLLLQVADHSIDMNAMIGRVHLQTRYGELQVEFMDALPDVIFDSCVGRTIDAIVDHVAWRGRGWRIVGTIEPTELSGQILIVAMGSVPFCITWPA